MTRLAYLGPPGTFSEEAALRYLPDAEIVPLASESAIGVAVDAGDVDEGILAIENSLAGTVTRTIDVLVHDTKLAIRAELVLPVELCLIAQPGTKLGDIRVVRSIQVALDQCQRFVERELPGVTQEASLSTAAAVREVVGKAGAAAIGTARAAELHGGEVLERGIQDNPYNKTRFVAVGHADSEPTGRDKTSIAFSVAHDKPGTLVEVLHEFSDRAINLTKIESRPSREELGVYIFLIDLEGHRTDPDVAAALAAVEAKAFFFRNLGSYPRYDDA